MPRVGVRDIDTCLLLLMALAVYTNHRWLINSVHDHHFAVVGGRDTYNYVIFLKLLFMD